MLEHPESFKYVNNVKILKIGQSAGNLDKVFKRNGFLMTNPNQKETLGEIVVCRELIQTVKYLNSDYPKAKTGKRNLFDMSEII